MHNSWHQDAYRRVYGKVTMYTSQKQKGHLPLINHKKGTHQVI